MTYFNIIGAYENEVINIRVYQKTKFPMIQEGRSYSLKNLVKKGQTYWVVSCSTIGFTAKVNVDPNIMEGNFVLPENQPTTGMKRSLKEALTSPEKSTIVGKISQVSPVKHCRDGTLAVRTIALKDNSGKVALFPENAVMDFLPQSIVEITAVYKKDYNDKPQLTATSSTICQVYCIRVPFNDNTITAVYALLPNKTRACYEELLQAVVDKCEEMHLELNITTVVSDFEDAVLRAIMAVFGRDVSSRGCFYHFTQATWRHIQGLGLAAHYNQSEEFRLFCGMLDGLAFLPIDDVAEGMEYVKSRVADHPEGEELVEYFDRTYVSGTFRRRQGEGLALTVRRVAPMFPPHVWNVHETTLAGDARTNNVCEGWNTKFFNLVGHHHPSVWRTIEWFQKEQTTVRIVIAQDSIGNMPVKKTKSIFVKMQRRLHRLCTDIASGRKSVPEFLNGVAKNIRLNKTS